MSLIKRMNYTWQHKKAFLQTEKKLLGHNTLAGYLHDTDKLFLYILLCWAGKESKLVQKIHRKTNRHHAECNKAKQEKHYLQMMIDWECARFTKPDKPLNAYETMVKFYPQLSDKILPLIKKYLPNEIQR